MSDTEHKILVHFEADTKQLKTAMDQVNKDSKKLHKQSVSAGKQEVKHHKAIRKETEVLKKFNKIEAPSLKLKNNALITQTKQMAAQTKELQKQHTLLSRMKQMALSAGRTARGNGFSGGGFGGYGKGGHGSFGRGRWFSNNRFGGFARGVVGAGAGLAALGLGSLISMPFAAVGSDYQAYVSYMRSMSPLAGLADGMPFGAGASLGKKDGSQSGTLNAAVKNMQKYGYMPDEVIKASSMFGRATGSVGDTEFGLGAARGLGMDAGEVAQIFAELRRGQGGFGAQGKRDFQKILSAAVKSGVDASTLPEYLEGVKGLTARAGGDLGGAVSSLPYAQLLSVFQKSGFAGLQGARGASIAAALEGMIKQPGGGAEGKAFMQASLGFGRLGGAGYYEIEKLREKGFQGGGAGVIKRMIDLADQSGGSEQEANLYLRELSGNRIGLDQWETIRKAIGSGNQAELDKILQNATATELDILQKIEKNTSAHAFVEAGELAAKLLKQDIERGAEYAKSIESIQQTMQDFLKETMPAVAAALEVTADLLKDLGPVMKSLKSTIEETFGRSKTEKAADSVTHKTQDAASALAANPFDDTDPAALRARMNAEKQGVAALNEALGYITSGAEGSAEAVPEFLQGRVSRQSAGFGLTEDQRASMWRMSADNRSLRQNIFTLLSHLVESRNVEGISGVVNTGDEAIAALRALGVNVNAGDRARTDSSGGSR